MGRMGLIGPIGPMADGADAGQVSGTPVSGSLPASGARGENVKDLVLSSAQVFAGLFPLIRLVYSSVRDSH